ncbi:hypothetical protein WS70_10575 [Burkholderia mayonis]|uniref:Uncharacterized protein n=1 Tax=Burkholderia mayonis TaxID=1385591 RepID=A0A1B4FEW8_9BURK|nr:hypothetical protein WS70_10575 [Burkholderia mayonis]KVE34324.1 hypothetical protein WS69_17220 [Burkholderia sp. BDU5]KVE44162.1 hypothetical protein WS70_08425 [Burkholderia mayonis]
MARRKFMLQLLEIGQLTDCEQRLKPLGKNGLDAMIIRVSETTTAALRRRVMKTFQAIGMEKLSSQLVFGTSWTAMAV